MADTIEKQDELVENQDAVEGGAEGAATETPADATKDLKPVEQEKVTEEPLPPGVSAKKLTDKDLAQLKALNDLEQKLQVAALAALRGIAGAINEINRGESMKAQFSADLLKKHEIPQDAKWQADYSSGKIYWALPEAPPAAPGPVLAPAPAPATKDE